MKHTIQTKTLQRLIAGALLMAMSLTSIAYAAQTATLTTTEKAWLTYLREEEKVARDVYLFLYDVWGAAIFKNIAASEQRHMDSIKMLLDKYRIADPAAGKEQGEFANPELQALYDELVDQGSLSLTDALSVGVLIEETNIADLQAALAATKQKSIKNVYGNLLQGSLNHLRAFQTNLSAQQ